MAPISTDPTPVVARKPFSRTIAALGIVAALIAVCFLALVLYEARRMPTPQGITAGGALILRAEVSTGSELEGSPPLAAFDRDLATAWGIQPNLDRGNTLGTQMTITLSEEQHITRVGIMNESVSSDLANVAELRWATSIEAIDAGDASVVVQVLDDTPDSQTVDVDITTEQLVVAVFGVHGEALTNVAVSEILIEVE